MAGVADEVDEIDEELDDEEGEGSEPETDDEAEEPPPREGGPDPIRPSRTERRAARGSKHAELERRAREAEELAERVQREAEFQRQQTLYFQQQALLTQQQARAQQQPEADPFKERLDLYNSRIRELGREYDALPVEQQRLKADEYQRRYQDLENEKSQVLVDRSLQPHLQRVGQFVQQQHDPRQQQDAAVKAALQLEFQDLIPARFGGRHKDDTLIQYWDGIYKTQVAMGKQPGPELMRECAEKTRQAFRLPGAKRPATTATERARFSGRSASAGDPTGNVRQGRKELSTIEKRMARKAYPYLEETKAYSKFRKEMATQAEDD